MTRNKTSKKGSNKKVQIVSLLITNPRLAYEKKKKTPKFKLDCFKLTGSPKQLILTFSFNIPTFDLSSVSFLEIIGK